LKTIVKLPNTNKIIGNKQKFYYPIPKIYPNLPDSAYDYDSDDTIKPVKKKFNIKILLKIQ